MEAIQTERLILRPYMTEDLEDLYLYHQLEEVARYQFWTERTREELRAKIETWIPLSDFKSLEKNLALVVVEKQSNQVIGDVFLGILDIEARQSEIGYSFNPQFHRRGFATETVTALLNVAFDDYGLHRVTGRCDAKNDASWGLMESLGFRREAHFKEHALFKGRWDEEFVYAMLEDEWRARRSAG